MARHEPSRRDTPTGDPLEGKLRMRRDAKGRWQVVPEPNETRPTSETAARPVHPDDPRPGPWRNIPPIGIG